MKWQPVGRWKVKAIHDLSTRFSTLEPTPEGVCVGFNFGLIDIVRLTAASQYGQIPRSVYCGVTRYFTGAVLEPAV